MEVDKAFSSAAKAQHVGGRGGGGGGGGVTDMEVDSSAAKAQHDLMSNWEVREGEGG